MTCGRVSGQRDGVATRRPGPGACARITCTENIGPHEYPDASDGAQGAPAEARKGSGQPLCSRRAGRTPRERRSSDRCREVGQACGDSRGLVLGAGGDAQGFLSSSGSWKSGSPRLAANLRGHPRGARLRCGACVFVLRDGSYQTTVTGHGHSRHGCRCTRFRVPRRALLPRFSGASRPWASLARADHDADPDAGGGSGALLTRWRGHCALARLWPPRPEFL